MKTTWDGFKNFADESVHKLSLSQTQWACSRSTSSYNRIGFDNLCWILGYKNPVTEHIIAIRYKIVIMNPRILARTIYQQWIISNSFERVKFIIIMLCLSWVILCQIKSNAWHLIETYLFNSIPKSRNANWRNVW